MNAAIKKLKRNKSLGPDKIPNEIFIEANKETRKVLKEILEKVHKEEEIPRSWEEGEIIRLYKGKGLKGKCSNERGITLASNVGKLYERIINERVKKQVTITKAQAGGKPGCSTVDHLIVLKQTISEIRAKGQTAYIIFLDVQKAYDKAWLDAIIYALHQNGVKGKNLRMIKNLNSNLTAKIQTRHGLTRKIQIKDSMRQGGVLSVIEYATLIDEIAKELRLRNLGYVTQANITLDSLLWMDDVCLIHHDLEKLQEILDVTNHVANKYHIQFGAAKCKVIKRGNGKKSSLKLNGDELEEVPAYKYLGEILNNKEDVIRTGPGRISSHCDVICTGASPGRISSHCDVICTGPGYGGITRANKFTLRRYLHGGITRANNPEMWTRYVLLFPGAHGGPRLFGTGAAPRPILSPALPPC